MAAADMRGGAAAAPRWRSALAGLYLTIRFSAFGFTGLLPLVGAASVAGVASVAGGWNAPLVLWLLAIALAFHIFAYMLNDVVDLWVDRSEPLRADSPLVRGSLGRGQALLIACLQVPLAFVLAWAAGAGAAAFGWLALAFAAMALYDLYGKRCPWPVLTDAVQSAGWCSLLLFGAVFSGGTPNAATGWLATYVFLCVMLVNGVHGSLRDLANDQRRGARTTALWLGARPGAGSGVLVSPWLALYTLGLQAGMVLCALGTWQVLPHATHAASARALGLLLVVLGAAVLSLLAASRQAADRRTFIAAGAWNIVATLLVLPALMGPLLGLAGSAVLLAVLCLPVLAMWAYNGSHWRLKDSSV
jgi:4-hydroxybenzoate polyprenyltransferase